MGLAFRHGSGYPAVLFAVAFLLGGSFFLSAHLVLSRDNVAYFRPTPAQSSSQPAPRPAEDPVATSPSSETSALEDNSTLENAPHKVEPPSVEVVVASMKKEDTSWVGRHLPDWSHQIYVVDNPKAPLTVPVNKGREAMVFLTHFIDHYDTLADVTMLVHASRFQWHNDDPDYDLLPSLRRANLDYILSVGYTNLRCVWVIGCPVEIRPFDDQLRDEDPRPDGPLTTKQVFLRAFSELLPGVDMPPLIGVSCCSQFAVSKEAVRRRPKEDYIGFRQWIIDTDLTDDLSGRVLEYMWHIIFGKDAVHCPNAQDCYCKLWGLCNLTCTHRECAGRYILPTTATFPDGWPRIGWDGEEREFTGPLP